MTNKHRRLSALLLVYALQLVACSGSSSPSTDTPGGGPGGSTSPNPIVVENQRPGTSAWQLTDPATNHEIEGFASLTSVNRGDQIQFFVNTADPSYVIEFFRMGWYGGQGGRSMGPPVSLPGGAQPAPSVDSTTGLIECNWTQSYSLMVNNPFDPNDWTSGVYLAKLTGSSGKQSYIIFIVRDDSRSSDLLFQLAVNTYQAYNGWGGKSLYRFNSSNQIQAFKVSFNRPYGMTFPKQAFGVGAGEFLQATFAAGTEYDAVRFLERLGYDVSYATNVDIHENSSLLLKHKGFLSMGHDEYWSFAMRSNVTASRDQGVNLGFFSANTCYWQVRFEPSPINAAPDRTIVAYKEFALTEDPYALDSDPTHKQLVTTQWREPPVNMPEAALIGVMYVFGPVSGDIVIQDASSWVFAGTGLQPGSKLVGLLGYEVDGMFPSSPQGTILLAHSPFTDSSGSVSYSDMTVYTTAKGTTVFASGTIHWNWGLDNYASPTEARTANPAVQQGTQNILRQFGAVAGP